MKIRSGYIYFYIICLAVWSIGSAYAVEDLSHDKSLIQIAKLDLSQHHLEELATFNLREIGQRDRVYRHDLPQNFTIEIRNTGSYWMEFCLSDYYKTYLKARVEPGEQIIVWNLGGLPAWDLRMRLGSLRENRGFLSSIFPFKKGATGTVKMYKQTA